MSPTNPTDARYTLTELADLAGVTPRTVRYYLSQGLLPAVGASGPGAKYDDAHLARLRLIRRLQREHQPLAEIRRQLGSIGDADVVALAEAPDTDRPSDSALDYIRRVTASSGSAPRPRSALRSVAEAAPAYGTALARRMELPPQGDVVPPAPDPEAPSLRSSAPVRVDRAQWERITLAPDVELHIRRPLARSTAKRVDRLIEIAHDLLEEERP